MICSVYEIEPNSNIPTLPRKAHHNVVVTYNVTSQPQAPGKFAILAGALSKIIAVAAIVLNVGVTAGIVDAEPAVDEISSTPTPIQTATATTTASETAPGREPNLPVDETESAQPPCPGILNSFILFGNNEQIP